MELRVKWKENRDMDTADDSLSNLESLLQIVKDFMLNSESSQIPKQNLLNKLRKLYKCTKKKSLTEETIRTVEMAIEKLKTSSDDSSDESVIEFFDLTSDTEEITLAEEESDTKTDSKGKDTTGSAEEESDTKTDSKGKDTTGRSQDLVRTWPKYDEKAKHSGSHMPSSDSYLDELIDFRRYVEKERSSAQNGKSNQEIRVSRSQSRCGSKSPKRSDRRNGRSRSRSQSRYRRGSTDIFRRSYSIETKPKKRRSRSRRRSTDRRSSFHLTERERSRSPPRRRRRSTERYRRSSSREEKRSRSNRRYRRSSSIEIEPERKRSSNGNSTDRYRRSSSIEIEPDRNRSSNGNSTDRYRRSSSIEIEPERKRSSNGNSTDRYRRRGDTESRSHSRYCDDSDSDFSSRRDVSLSLINIVKSKIQSTTMREDNRISGMAKSDAETITSLSQSNLVATKEKNKVMEREKISFTITKSLKCEKLTTINKAFSRTDESASKNLTDLKSKLSTLITSVLNVRQNDDDNGRITGQKKECPKSDTPKEVDISNQANLNDDEMDIDNDVIQQIVSQSAENFSKVSAEKLAPNLTFNVDVIKNVLATAKMNELKNNPAKGVEYPGNSLMKDRTAPSIQTDNWNPAKGVEYPGNSLMKDITGPSIQTDNWNVPSISTPIGLLTPVKLPIPSPKFLPRVPLKANRINNPFKLAPYPPISPPKTYGEYKKLNATNYSHENQFKNPKSLPKAKMNRPISTEVGQLNRNDTEERLVNMENDNGSENYIRPTLQSEENANNYPDDSPAKKNVSNNPVKLPIPSSKFVPRVPFRATAVPIHDITPLKANRINNPFNLAPYPPIPPPKTYGEYKKLNPTNCSHENQFKIPNSLPKAKINRPISTEVAEVRQLNQNDTEERVVNMENDSGSENYIRPTLQSEGNANKYPDDSPAKKNVSNNNNNNDEPREKSAMKLLTELMSTNQFVTFVDTLTKVKEALTERSSESATVKDVAKGANVKDPSQSAKHITRHKQNTSNTTNSSLISKPARRVNEVVPIKVNTTSFQGSPKPTFKNIDPELHSLKKILVCQACDKPPGLSLISHYVNEHPNTEVLVSRLSPEAAESARSPAHIDECKIIRKEGSPNYEYQQFCYFCNIYKCFNKQQWIQHMAVHTGYYSYRCQSCSRKFSIKPANHKCGNWNCTKIPQPQLKSRDIFAYVCDLCNYVRFQKEEIENHLINEHEDNSDKFKKVLFLSFPKKQSKMQLRKDSLDDFLATDDELESDDYQTESEDEETTDFESEFEMDDEESESGSKIESEIDDDESDSGSESESGSDSSELLEEMK